MAVDMLEISAKYNHGSAVYLKIMAIFPDLRS